MNYTSRKDKFSLFADPSFRLKKRSFDDLTGNVDTSGGIADSELKVGNKMLMSDDVARAAVQGGASGGLSGALTSGGVASLLKSGAGTGNVAAIGGGLILSQIEEAKRLKAQQAQQRVEDEIGRRTNMANLLNSFSRTRFR